MTSSERELRSSETWISWWRLLAVPFALFEIGLLPQGFPPGYARWAWAITGALVVGAPLLWWLARRVRESRLRALGIAALAFDTALVAAYVVLFYSFEPNTAVRQLLFLPVAEAAVRYGIRGGVLVPLALAPALAVAEAVRADRMEPRAFTVDAVTVPLGVQLLAGLIVGWLAQRLRSETARAEERAQEAEALRDQIGRRADQLEAVNRCGLALASSLDADEAFQRFLREARTAFEFDRIALVVVDGDRAEVLGAAGVEVDSVFAKGTARPVPESIVADVLGSQQTIVRDDMAASPQYPEEEVLVRIGLRSRVVAPLALADRTLGVLSVSRAHPNAFARDEVDMISLLGREAATAVENMRAFEAERNAAEELRRLSALRADFVSLVSHELRTPMAAVIGSAATLRTRWRTLTPEQRESFLALIEEETARLADLIGDVLDTSRLDAGTFTYTFGDVDVEELVRETAAVADLGQEEIAVRAEVESPLPPVQGDRERLRQLLLNLVTNAVKYTVPGDEVTLRASAVDGDVAVSVCDN
ncbi:MAG: GAF domain-containing protein, partial [Actinobacteria bacterium]|nr:GAF domain-containing protein [Actinomycetota bacterium]